MNPLQWLKAAYEAFGTPHPRSSLILVSALGAISFAAMWIMAAKLVAKDRPALNTPSQTTGPASTTGDNSPAVTGNGNEIKYDQSSHPEKQADPPKKE